MKTKTMRILELERQQRIEEILSGLFAEGLNHEQVAGKLNISVVTLYAWLDRLHATVETRRSLRFPADEPAGTSGTS